MPFLLLLHGWGGNADSFAAVKKYFATTYQVLAPTLPCPPATVYTLDDYATDIANYLQAHGVTQCAVIAHSFGARVVAVLNQRNPALFNKIIITGGAGLKPRFSLGVWLKIRWYKLRKKLFGKATGGSADYRNLDANGQATFRNIINRDLTPAIRQITAPLLLITGSKDTATPVYMLKKWARLAPQARTIIYQGHGHFAYLECPARFIKDCEAFLHE